MATRIFSNWWHSLFAAKFSVSYPWRAQHLIRREESKNYSTFLSCQSWKMSSASSHNENTFSQTDCCLFLSFRHLSGLVLAFFWLWQSKQEIYSRTPLGWHRWWTGGLWTQTSTASDPRARAAFSLLNTRRWVACHLLNSAAKVELSFLSLVKSAARSLDSYLLPLLSGLFIVCFSFASSKQVIKM